MTGAGRVARALSVAAAAEEAGDRVALVLPDGTERTWAGLAARVAAREDAAPAPLADVTEPPLDVRPAILRASPDAETVESLYGSFARGVPRLLLDPAAPAAEEKRWAAILEGSGSRRAGGGADRSPAAERPGAVSAAPSIPDERALWIVPTSGSTGRPKAVVLSRRAAVASADASAANLGWREDDRWLVCLPLFHVGGASILVRILAARRTAVLAGGDRFDAARILALARDTGVTLMSLVPTQLRRLLELGEAAAPPPGLRAVLLGGAPAGPDLLRSARRRGWPVLTTWGMTETGGQVTTQPLGVSLEEVDDAGRVLEGIEVRVAPGGRLEVRGPILYAGTVDERGFLARSGDWLRTRDLGVLEQGRLRVLGRLDDVILSGGENVRPREIEEVLEACPGILEAVVVGLPDPEWGERVVAAVRTAPGSAPPAESWAAERLLGARRPKEIRRFDDLPRTPSGKVDRRAVRDLLKGATRA